MRRRTFLQAGRTHLRARRSLPVTRCWSHPARRRRTRGRLTAAVRAGPSPAPCGIAVGTVRIFVSANGGRTWKRPLAPWARCIDVGRLIDRRRRRRPGDGGVSRPDLRRWSWAPDLRDVVDGLTTSFAISLRPVRRAKTVALLVRDLSFAAARMSLQRPAGGGRSEAAFIEKQFIGPGHVATARPDRMAVFLVVERDDEPMGRLYVVDLPEEVRSDRHRDPAGAPWRRGSGRRSMEAIVREADASRSYRSRLYVEPWNPARRLYERLGFVAMSQRGVYELMERAPTEARSDQLKTAS